MSMSKTFVVNDYKIAEIMEILMDTKMTVYDDGKYGFLRTPFINRVYAQAKTLVEKYNL